MTSDRGDRSDTAHSEAKTRARRKYILSALVTQCKESVPRLPFLFEGGAASWGWGWELEIDWRQAGVG